MTLRAAIFVLPLVCIAATTPPRANSMVMRQATTRYRVVADSFGTIEGNLYLVINEVVTRGTANQVSLIPAQLDAGYKWAAACQKEIAERTVDSIEYSEKLQKARASQEDIHVMAMRLGELSALNAQWRNRRADAIRSAAIQTVPTGISAHYRFTHVPPGRYALFAQMVVSDTAYWWFHHVLVAGRDTQRIDLDDKHRGPFAAGCDRALSANWTGPPPAPQQPLSAAELLLTTSQVPTGLAPTGLRQVIRRLETLPRKGEFETSTAYAARMAKTQQYYAISLGRGRNGCDEVYETKYVADSDAWHLTVYTSEVGGNPNADLDISPYKSYDVDCSRTPLGVKVGTTAGGARVNYAIQQESHFGLLWAAKSGVNAYGYAIVVSIPSDSAAQIVPKIRVIAVVKAGVEQHFGLLLNTKDETAATFSAPVETHRAYTYLAVDEFWIVTYNAVTGAIYSRENLSNTLVSAP